MPRETELLEQRDPPRYAAASNGDVGVAPLTAEQRERWLASQFDPPGASPRIDLWIVDWPGAVQRDALAAAVRSAVERYEALRTTYLADGSGQQVRALNVADSVVELAPTSAPSAFVEQMRAHAHSSFDREHGPLARFWWVPHTGGGRLVFAAHQSVVDEESGRTVVAEVTAEYTRAIRGGSMVQSSGGKPSPSAQAESERRQANSSVVRDAVEFWRQRLASIPEAPELPLDRTRPAMPTNRAGLVRDEISTETVSHLRAIACEEVASLDDVLLSAWGALVHRLSGSDHFLIGVAMHAPPGHVGPTQFFRPLSVRFDPASSFCDLLHATTRERGEVLRHAHCDFGAIVREQRRVRDAARPWLCSVTFAFHSAAPLCRVGDQTADVVHEPAPQLDGELALIVREHGTRLAVECRFNQDLFDLSTARRWLQHYLTLLRSIARAPAEAVARLELLTAGERREILEDWNPARLPMLPGPALLHLAFAAHAARRPEHPAVMTEEASVTYADLDARANRLAHALKLQGVSAGQYVALLLERSMEYAVAVLGTLKAGAAFVPIDPEWPGERKELVVRDCAAAALITTARLATSGTGHELATIDLQNLPTGFDQLPSSAPEVDVTPEHPAYVIYTSGSTGKPKGVIIPHRAAAVHMASIAAVYRLGPDDRSLLFHSVAFDPAIEQLFAPWTVGATVVMRGSGLWSGREFSDWVRREHITAVTLPPLYFLQLLRDWEHEPALAPVGILRRVLVGGEALPPAVVELWRRLGLTSIRLLNGYGPTECTVTATVHDLPPTPAANENCGRLPIGRPQGPVEAYVLDEHLQPQPIGVAGELCLAGPTLARGYLGREVLTQERFLSHPFRSAARLYRTGDRARWLADGTIDFCGRADRQVKIGGYRIEPGETEAALGRLPGVSACAVVVEKEPRGELALIGYVVPVPGVSFDADAIRAALAVGLPRYMVPARLVAVPELPRTINGKLDAGALARHGAAARAREESARAQNHDAAAVSVPVHDEQTAKVAKIWTAVLGRPSVDKDDNFFDCGGHSLLAIDLFSRLERAFQTRLAVRDWLADPTFAALVRLVSGEAAVDATSVDRAEWKFLFPINPAGTRPRLFLFAGGRGCDEDFIVLAALTRALGVDQPVWGVRVGGPDRLQPMHGDAYALAADVVREIRRHQPDGPYHLAGECIGGLLAYEVARLLTAEGASVAFLGIINTGCPRFAESFRWWIRTTWIGRAKQMARPLLGVLRHSTWREVPGHLREAWRRVARGPHANRPARNDGMPEDPKDYHYGKMLLRYRPSPSPVPVNLLACETFQRAINQRRWSRHSQGGVKLVPLRGDTTTCIREHAGESAAQLRAALDRGTAQRDPRLANQALSTWAAA